MILQKKLIIFDLDGTLIDNRASFAEAYRKFSVQDPELYEPGNSEIEQALIHFYLSGFSEAGYRQVVELLAPKRVPPLKALARYWGMEYAINAIQLPRSIDTLEYLLARGYRIGLLTNGNSQRQWAKVHSCGLYHYFEDVIVSGDHPYAKPDPAIFHLSLSHFGIEAKDALFVGDTPETDITGANRAGIDSLWLTPGTENTAGATYIAHDVSFLKTIL